MNVYLIQHDQYAYLGVPALSADLFKDAVPEFRAFRDDDDYPFSRERKVVSVTRQSPRDALDGDPSAECSIWTLSDDASTAFERIWSANSPDTEGSAGNGETGEQQ